MLFAVLLIVTFYKDEFQSSGRRLPQHQDIRRKKKSVWAPAPHSDGFGTTVVSAGLNVVHSCLMLTCLMWKEHVVYSSHRHPRHDTRPAAISYLGLLRTCLDLEVLNQHDPTLTTSLTCLDIWHDIFMFSRYKAFEVQIFTSRRWNIGWLMRRSSATLAFMQNLGGLHSFSVLRLGYRCRLCFSDRWRPQPHVAAMTVSSSICTEVSA